MSVNLVQSSESEACEALLSYPSLTSLLSAMVDFRGAILDTFLVRRIGKLGTDLVLFDLLYYPEYLSSYGASVRYSMLSGKGNPRGKLSISNQAVLIRQRVKMTK